MQRRRNNPRQFREGGRGAPGALAGRRVRHRLPAWILPCLVLACLSLFLRCCVAEAHQSLRQRGIAGEVLRFHVLANSDSEKDQRAKLEVRDRVLSWMEEALGQKDYTKEETVQFVKAHLKEITAVSDEALEENGLPYRAYASLEICWFPERTYGDCTFPAGYYEALRLCLGKADGKNWWCVLYPGLCFSGCLKGAQEGEGQKLEKILTEEAYEELLRTPSRWRIAFRWF